MAENDAAPQVAAQGGTSDLTPLVSSEPDTTPTKELDGRPYPWETDPVKAAEKVPVKGVQHVAPEDATKEQLLEAARAADIPGRSQMAKEELAAAVAKEGGEGVVAQPAATPADTGKAGRRG